MRSVLKYACLAALILCLLCSALACTPASNNGPNDQSKEETTAGDLPTTGGETTAEDPTGEATTEGGTTDGVTGDEAPTEEPTTEAATTADAPGLELYPDETDTNFNGVTRN